MKRLLCGSVVLAASLGLVSCNGDPTSEFRDGPTRIVADPSVVFVDQGEAEEVVFRLTNDAGDPLAGEWEVTETGSGISVERNPNYLPTTTGAPLESEVQFIITAGDAPQGTSFIVSAGELEDTIAVNILPTSLETGTFSNATPALNEPVTLTAEGYTFMPDAVVTVGADPAGIISNDGTSITFVPTPGSTGPALVDNVSINFLPDVPLSLTTSAELTVPAGPVGGTTDPSTAPTVATPAAGAHTIFYDTPDFAASLDHWYKLTITEAGTYTISMDWDIGDDIDMFVCPAPGAIVAECNFAGATADHPELQDYELTPGDWYIIADDFGQAAGGTAAIGALLTIEVSHATPTGELKKNPSTSAYSKAPGRFQR